MYHPLSSLYNIPCFNSSYDFMLEKTMQANAVSFIAEKEGNYAKLYQEFLNDNGQETDEKSSILKNLSSPSLFNHNSPAEYLQFVKTVKIFHFLNKKTSNNESNESEILKQKDESTQNSQKEIEIHIKSEITNTFDPLQKEKKNQINTFSHDYLLDFFDLVLKSKDTFNEKMSSFLTKTNEINSQAYEVFMIFAKKYCKIKKTKEEYTKFLFRKFFKQLKREFEKTKQKLPKKTINHLFMMHYFSYETIDSETGKTNVLKTKPTVDLIKKKELFKFFKNQKFLNEFEIYLKTFQMKYKEESRQKIHKLIFKIIKLAEKNKLLRVSKIAQLPWIDTWIENCYRLGQDLIDEYKNSLVDN